MNASVRRGCRGHRLLVRVVETADGHRHAGAVPVGPVRHAVRRRSGRRHCAHARSPIQKQINMNPPTPKSRATKPSVTGPMPPRPAPPGFTGCWMFPVT